MTGALSGFSSTLAGRVLANTVDRKKPIETTLLAQTKAADGYQQYMCGTDPPAETSCETDLRLAALVQTKPH